MNAARNVIGGLGNLMFKQAYIYARMRDGEIPDMYVQSSKYWDNYADEIKSLYSANIKPVDAVALHIRRGDYVDNPFYVNLWETEYYKKGISLFPNDRFIVFCRDNQGVTTDKADRQWCRDNLDPLIKGRYELPSLYNKEHEDMNLMAGCKSIIMANSSFSWWASFLGDHEKVICPKQWYSDGLERTEPQPEWIRL